MKHLRIKTKLFQRAALTLLTLVMAFTTQTAWAGYGWWNGSMSIGGITTDCTAWSTDSNNPTDLGIVTDMTISSIAFKVWSDANDRGGANMFFRIWDGGTSQVGSDQDLWLGTSTRIEGEHDFSISWTGSEDLAAAVGLTLMPGKTYYITMWAKTYGNSGDEWYSGDNSRNYHAKLTIAPIYLSAKKGLGDNLWATFYSNDFTFQLDKSKACVYYATMADSKVVLHKLGTYGDVIPKGTAVIIVGDNPGGNETANIALTAIEDVSGPSAEGNVLRGVDVATSVSDVCSTYGATKIYMLSNKNGFGFYPLGNDMTVPASKAFIPVNESASSARGFSIEFDGDDATGIRTINNVSIDSDNWYSLDGRKFSSKPSQRGIYINNGKKVVIN